MNPIEAYIRQAARARGLDENVVMNVVMNEGGVSDPTNRSRGFDPSIGGQEISYGPLQMNMHRGLGADLLRTQGVDVRDPSNVYKGIDYGLDAMATHGMTPWLNTMNKLGYNRWSAGGAGKAKGVGDSTYTVAGPDGKTASMQSPSSVRHPPNPTVGTGDLGGGSSPYTIAKKDDLTPRQKAFKGIANAVAGMGGSTPQVDPIQPTPQAARVDAPVQQIVDPNQQQMQRYQLAQILARLNQGSLV